MLVFAVLSARQLSVHARLTGVFGKRHFAESPVRPTLVAFHRHRSICSLASVSDVNQCACRHSSHIRYFLAVSKYRNFTHATEALHVHCSGFVAIRTKVDSSWIFRIVLRLNSTPWPGD